MDQLSIGDKAPDFELLDLKGNKYLLSDIYKTKNVLLVFNIGFAWPHCTNHMAQLRQDYSRFQQFNTDIMVLVPNGPKLIEKYTRTNDIPYTILSDKGSKIAAQFFQVKKFFAFGTPTVFLIDQTGKIIYTHYAGSLIEEPDNEIPLKILDKLSSQE